ncbi:MAG: NUDIX hydrolase [Erysipelotrichaceae bacterium]|nr:NUDIX hydrolase [Erysipelotrichaceae bacterium]
MDIDLDKVKIVTDYPIIARIKDDLYPYNGYDHIRQTVRALAENEEGKFAFLHIVGEDYFGVRDHLETCGGGVEENESLVDAIQREIREEMGYEIKSFEMIGSILDAYNLIGRITLSAFVHVLIDTSSVHEMERTMEEQILIKEILWLDPEEALYRLENVNKNKVDLIVQRRDAAALRYYLQMKGSD